MSRPALAALLLATVATTAHAADDGKADRPAGDIIVKRTVNAPPAAVYAWLLDLDNHQAMWPEGCTQKWELGTTTSGIGASARLTYRPAMMRRRLTATLADGRPDQYLKVDHAGRTGFATTYALTDTGGQTAVEVHTWVNPPPWPLTNTFMNRVRPAWKSCHQGALDNLARAISAG